MPKYRFSWSNIPEDLARVLSDALGLEGNPAEALRAAYGARPKEVFIQEAWPILLSEWLPADDLNREWVVEQLKARSIGRTEIPTGSAAGQLDYLASCRNGATLREIVLVAFHELGEPTEELVVVATASPRAASVTSSEGMNEPDAKSGQTPENTASLIDWTKAVLAAFLSLEEVIPDPDGDIPIINGSSVTYVRVFDDDLPRVRFFSYLVKDLRPDPELFQVVNDINLTLPYAKAMVVEDGSAIVLAAEVPADSLSAGELTGMLTMVASNADYLDTMIQERFGGATWLPEPGERVDV